MGQKREYYLCRVAGNTSGDVTLFADYYTPSSTTIPILTAAVPSLHLVNVTIPLGDVRERLCVGDVVDKKNSACSSIVR